MKTVRMELYSVYERIWHWVQAVFILLMMWTGLCIHNPDAWGACSFPRAVAVHNVLGLMVMANAFFGLFYYLSTGTIRQYLPRPHGFGVLAVRQAMYYLRGIFRHEPHPLQKTSAFRLNPLQQLTYLIILNALLPLQVTTGILMWSGQRWPEGVFAAGGIQPLAMIHVLGAWLFAGFVVAHVYLTTTGHTPLANLKAMIVGYEDVPTDHSPYAEYDGPTPPTSAETSR